MIEENVRKRRRRAGERMEVQTIWSEQDAESEECLHSAVQSSDLAGALLAIEGATASTRAACRQILSLWGETLAEHLTLAGATTHTSSAKVLAQVMGAKLDLRGDTKYYYSPRNNHLSRVLEGRRGMPILLSCIWIEVGKQAGLTVEGIGLPGHFIIRVGKEETGVLCDPFESGEMLDIEDCQHIVRRLEQDELVWDERFLEACSVRNIAERVLRNLLGSYQQRQNNLALYRTARLLSSLCPQRAEFQLLHGRLAEELGALSTARKVYEGLVAQFPQASQSHAARKRLAPLRKITSHIN